MFKIKKIQLFPPATEIKDPATKKWARALMTLLDDNFRRIGLANADNIKEGDTNKFAAESGADVTADHEAATIVNQGALALLDAVDTGQIVDTAVTEAKLASLAVTLAKLAANAVSSDKIVNLAVTEAKLASLSVSQAKLATDAVSSDKVVNLAITEGKLAALSVSLGKLAADSVDKDKLTVPGVDADGKLVLGQIGSGDADNIDASATRKWAGEAGATVDQTGAEIKTAYEVEANAYTDTKDTKLSGVEADADVTGGKIHGGWVEAGNNDLWTLTAGKNRIEDDGDATYERTFRYWEGWSGNIYLGYQRALKGVVTGKKYRVLARMKKIGSPNNATIGIYNETKAEGVYYVNPLGSLTTDFQVVDLGLIDADWDEGDSVRLYFGDADTSPDDTDANSIFIDWMSIDSVDAAVGADVTVDNTAANVTGQGALATLNTVNTAQIDNNAIVASKILAGEIGTAHLVALAVTAGKIAALAIETDKLAANAVTAAKIAAGTITATEIAALTIEAGNIAANAIETAKINALAVTADKIAANTITAAKIAAGTITATEMVALSIGTRELVAESITAAKIAALAIETDKIAANAITAAKILVASLGAIHATLGTVVAGFITGTTITGGIIRTATSGRRIVIDSSGIKFMSASPASGKIGTTGNGGDNIVIGTTGNGGDNEIIGSGYYVRFYNVDNGVAFYVQSEQTVASLHLFNRSSTPSGYAEVGDLAVIQGKLYICTAAGTPGTWTIVGTQT